MERSNTVDWLRLTRRFALGAGVALVTGVLMVGCGGSSSSNTDSNGGGGDTTPPPSGEVDTRDIAVEVASLAFDFEDYADLLAEAEFGAENPDGIVPLSVDAGASGNPLVSITGNILNLTKDAGEIGIQTTEEEFCDAGSVSITENESGYEIIFDQCQSDLLGTTFAYDGKTTYEKKENGGTLTYEDFQSTLSKAGDTLTIAANGTIDVVSDPFSPAGTVTLNLRYDLSVACGGAEASGSFTYDALVIERADNGGITVNGDQSFSFTDADGKTSASVSIETVEPLFFKDDSYYPYLGTMNVTVNGETIVIQYVETGVFIDEQFFTWEQIEADVDGDDFDSVFDQCSFFDFEA